MNKKISKKPIIPNIVDGGIAIPLGNNYYYMRGRKHKDGGIDIGPNDKNGLEVEDGEIMKTSPNEVKVFSSVPFLNGRSPVEKLLGGENPTTVFRQQEAYKDRNGINDDGTKKGKHKAEMGLEDNENPIIKSLGYQPMQFYDKNINLSSPFYNPTDDTYGTVNFPEVSVTPKYKTNEQRQKALNVAEGRRGAKYVRDAIEKYAFPIAAPIVGGAALTSMGAMGLLSHNITPIDVGFIASDPTNPVNYIPFASSIVRNGKSTYKFIDSGFTPENRILNQKELKNVLTRNIGVGDSGYKDALVSGVIRGNMDVAPFSAKQLTKLFKKYPDAPSYAKRELASGGNLSKEGFEYWKNVLGSNSKNTDNIGRITLNKKSNIIEDAKDYEEYLKIRERNKRLFKLELDNKTLNHYTNEQDNILNRNWKGHNQATFAYPDEILDNGDLFPGDYTVTIDNADRWAADGTSFGHFKQHPTTIRPIEWNNPDVTFYKGRKGLLSGRQYKVRLSQNQVSKDREKYLKDMLQNKKAMGGLNRSKDYDSKYKYYPNVDKKDFAGEHRKYPIPTKTDAVDTLRLADLHERSDVKSKVYSKYPELRKKSKGGGVYSITSNGQTILRMLPSTGEETYYRRKAERGLTTINVHGNKYTITDYSRNNKKSTRDIKDDKRAYDFIVDSNPNKSPSNTNIFDSDEYATKIHPNFPNGRIFIEHYGAMNTRGFAIPNTDGYNEYTGPIVRNQNYKSTNTQTTTNSNNAVINTNYNNRVNQNSNNRNTNSNNRNRSYNRSSNRNVQNNSQLNKSNYNTKKTSIKHGTVNTTIATPIFVKSNPKSTVKKDIIRDRSEVENFIANIFNRVYTKKIPEYIKPNIKSNIPKLKIESYTPIKGINIRSNIEDNDKLNERKKAKAGINLKGYQDGYLTASPLSGYSQTITPQIQALDIEPFIPIKGVNVDKYKDLNKRNKSNNNFSIGNSLNNITSIGSNIISSIAGNIVNNKSLNKMSYKIPEYKTMDYFGAPVYTAPTSLKTRYNINPQLRELDESQRRFELDVDAGTASSQTAIARKNAQRINNILNKNKLHAEKENIETELINKDKLNRQAVRSENAKTANTYLQNKAVFDANQLKNQQDFITSQLVAKQQFDNNIIAQKAENKINTIQNINASIQNVLSDIQKRRNENQTIAAMSLANPNLPIEILYEQGLVNKRVYEGYKKAYRQNNK